MADVYERLRDRLDMFPQGFPKTKSGVDIEVLQHLFTPEEAEIALHLRPRPEKLPAIAERMGKDEKELGETLSEMAKNGLILRFKSPDNQLYFFLIPWVVGIFEFQLKSLTPEKVELFERFYHEGMTSSWQDRKTGMFRVIPVEKEIQGGTEVQPYEQVSRIIESHTRFAVADCICRKERKILGEGCNKLMEACMSFGRAAAFYIENGLGREISQEEARKILQKAEEDGLIHCSWNHAGNKDFICNCCGCCCKALALTAKYDNLGFVVRSNYYAAKDYDTCTTCGTCVERCQMHAIQLENDRTVIDRKRCIGCGLCVSTCPTGSISLVKKSPEEVPAVFANQMEMLQAMGKEKGKQFPFE